MRIDPRTRSRLTRSQSNLEGGDNRIMYARTRLYSEGSFKSGTLLPPVSATFRPSPPRPNSNRGTRPQLHVTERTRSGSLSSNNSSSKGSVLTPKLMPWAIESYVNTKRIFPSGIEDPKLHHNGTTSSKSNVVSKRDDRALPPDDLSLSPGSENNTSLNDLHMERILNVNEQSLLKDPNSQKLSWRDNRMRDAYLSGHERSRSADFVDLVTRVQEYSSPYDVGQDLSKAWSKAPPGYGAADEHSNSSSDDDLSFGNDYENAEVSPFLGRSEDANFTERTNVSRLGYGDDDSYDQGELQYRSLRHRVFLVITDPWSSILGELCFAIIAFMILCSNIVLIVQTMDKFEYNPSDCTFCVEQPCVCPPRPLPMIVHLENYIMYFFTVEWVLRVICYDPPPANGDTRCRNPFRVMFRYATEPLSLLDLMAFLPYYFERTQLSWDSSSSFWTDEAIDDIGGVKGTPIFRIFRVFQLIRLGQYNSTFCALVNVIATSVSSLSILIVVLLFSAAFFGSIIYWLEQGDWMYTDLIDPPGYAHVRLGSDGLTKELSPFRSIPASFWWVIVTATTTGYGDTYPTTPSGKAVAALAMILGVLVIAFPVSVFSELWSKELKAVGAFRSVGGSKKESSEKARTPPKVISAKLKRRKSGYRANNFAQMRALSNPDFNTINDTPVVKIASIDEEMKENDSDGGENESNSSLDKNTEALKIDEALTMTDIEAIRHHLAVVDEAQSKIRMLLQKIESQTK